MSIPEIIEFILLPCMGWLLINSNKTQKRLTRIETVLELLVENHKPKTKKKRKRL